MEEQHSKTNVYGRVSYGYFRAIFQLCQSTRSIVLAVKGCLGVFFMVFKVAFILLVLLKGACFALILRLQICEAIWIGYASQKSVFSPWGFFHG
jgi:hypothetical protein